MENFFPDHGKYMGIFISVPLTDLERFFMCTTNAPFKVESKPNRGPHIPKIRAELNPPLKKMIAISLF